MKLFYSIILCFILLSCGKTKETTTSADSLNIAKPDPTKSDSLDDDTQFKLENYLTAEQTDTSKVQTIDFDCAVLIYPTDDQIEEMKKSGSEEDFETTMDDANFYMYNASHLIDSAGVKTVGCKKQFVKFVGDQKNWTLDVRKKDLAAWSLVMFKKSKSPQVTPTTDVTLELAKSYFEKK